MPQRLDARLQSPQRFLLQRCARQRGANAERPRARDLLKLAGVDMATPLPYQATIARMNQIMGQIEAILDRRDQ